MGSFAYHIKLMIKDENNEDFEYCEVPIMDEFGEHVNACECELCYGTKMHKKCPDIFINYSNKFMSIYSKILRKELKSYIEIARFINKEYFQMEISK